MTSEAQINQWLRDGITAARVGRREAAREMLLKVLHNDEEHEQAWLWLSGVMDSLDEQRICLENVLAINPGNQAAQRGLQALEAGNDATVEAAKPAHYPDLHNHEVATLEQVGGRSIPEHPCPYCGAATSLEQRRCPQCRQSLMLRKPATGGLRGLMGFSDQHRIVVVVEKKPHLHHYNAGIAYKDRGMWYMAAREWEAALQQRPHELNYRHALGLAYARLGWFDVALETLRRASDQAPNDKAIAESLAAVERSAGAK
jgi:tetratricopeptide (TPR) repeat protein